MSQGHKTELMGDPPRSSPADLSLAAPSGSLGVLSPLRQERSRPRTNLGFVKIVSLAGHRFGGSDRSPHA